MRLIAIILIRLYQWTLSPLLGPACRFHPTCSEYAREAIGRYGLLHGGALALRRLSRCHPWHEGGIDPVPPAALSPGSVPLSVVMPGAARTASAADCPGAADHTVPFSR